MKEILEAVDKLLRTCLEQFGVNTTLFLIFSVAIGLFLWRIYNDWRKGKEINAAIKAKDETIQVLAEHNREFRVIDLKARGWSDEMIDAVVLKNTPKDAIEAREMLQNSKRREKKEASKKESKPKELKPKPKEDNK